MSVKLLLGLRGLLHFTFIAPKISVQFNMIVVNIIFQAKKKKTHLHEIYINTSWGIH